MDQKNESHILHLFTICVVIVTLCFFYFLERDVLSFFLASRYYFLLGLSYILPIPFVENALYMVDTYTPKEWSFIKYFKYSFKTMWLISPIFIVIFIYFARKVYIKNPLNKLKRTFTRQSLCETEVSIWPWIKPVLNEKIIDKDLVEGKWAMGQSFLTFAKENNILQPKPLSIGETRRDNVNYVIIDESKAKLAFIKQLGKLYIDFEQLEKYEQALLVCFLAQLYNDKNEAVAGLKKLALSANVNDSPNCLNTDFIEEYKQKYLHRPETQKLMQQHAYFYNVIAKIYKEAKVNGKLPPSYFLWLKAYDRRLWYTLNNVGRKVSFIEVAGVIAHGLAEDVMQEKSIQPLIDETIPGLYFIINNEILIPNNFFD